MGPWGIVGAIIFALVIGSSGIPYLSALRPTIAFYRCGGFEIRILDRVANGCDRVKWIGDGSAPTSLSKDGHG